MNCQIIPNWSFSVSWIFNGLRRKKAEIRFVLATTTYRLFAALPLRAAETGPMSFYGKSRNVQKKFWSIASNFVYGADFVSDFPSMATSLGHARRRPRRYRSAPPGDGARIQDGPREPLNEEYGQRKSRYAIWPSIWTAEIIAQWSYIARSSSGE